MTEFRGFVSHIIYRNEENGYTVFEITLTGTGEKKEKADTAFEPFAFARLTSTVSSGL